MPARRQRKPVQLPVIVFGRAPQLGRGKTRLAADVGVLAAWRFQRNCLARTLRQLAADSCLTPDPLARGYKQGAGTFGARLLRLLSRRPMIVIASDLPEVSPRDIALARRALQRPGLVVGPSPDGGFWLIGWRGQRLSRRLFNQVRWSSAETLADLRLNQPRLRLIHSLADVDRAEDLRRLRLGVRRAPAP